MDVFHSRRSRNEQCRGIERGRGESDNSGGRDRRGDSMDRRSRSRDRSGHLPRIKSRSKSPQSEFLKVHDKWKKFKQSQRVGGVLDNIKLINLCEFCNNKEIVYNANA